MNRNEWSIEILDWTMIVRAVGFGVGRICDWNCQSGQLSESSDELSEWSPQLLEPLTDAHNVQFTPSTSIEIDASTSLISHIPESRLFSGWSPFWLAWSTQMNFRNAQMSFRDHQVNSAMVIFFSQWRLSSHCKYQDYCFHIINNRSSNFWLSVRLFLGVDQDLARSAQVSFLMGMVSLRSALPTISSTFRMIMSAFPTIRSASSTIRSAFSIISSTSQMITLISATTDFVLLQNVEIDTDMTDQLCPDPWLFPR